MTSWLGTGNWLTFLYSVCCFLWGRQAIGRFISESRIIDTGTAFPNVHLELGAAQVSTRQKGELHNWVRLQVVTVQPGAFSTGAIATGCAYNRVRLQLGALTTGCDCNWVRFQPGAIATGCAYNRVRLQLGCAYNRVRLQLGALTTGCDYNWVRLQLGACKTGYHHKWAQVTTGCDHKWVRVTIGCDHRGCGYNHGGGANWARAITRCGYNWVRHIKGVFFKHFTPLIKNYRNGKTTKFGEYK